MKKILFTLMCLATMVATGTGLKAQEVTIVLMPGWTWISIPSTDTLDFQTAFGSFTPAVGDIVKSQWGSAIYRGDGQWRGQVSQFYPGYGYHYYSTRTMPVFLTFNVQQPTPSVAVTTSEPMMITAVSAMGGGEVTTTDGTYIIVKGLCWATHENPTTNDDFYEEAESGVGSFSLSMTGLNISTTYYVRAYAVTGNGTVYGDQKTFTTRDGIPTVTTVEVTNITGATATCGGNITDNGGLNVTARGVCWSTSPNPTIADSHTTNGSDSGSFSSSITDLNVSTTYYVRAYATTNVGTAYGDDQSFTTRDGIPILTTADVINVQGTYAYCGGNIVDNCGLNITAKGICWSTFPNPSIADLHSTSGSGMGSFNSCVTELSVNTTYYVRAYASTVAGTGYGEQKVFTTEYGSHAYVDLGLPSGTLWATCNVGANSPEEYGDYFAWGETRPKDNYDWSTYHYSNGGFYDEIGEFWPYLTKYCNNFSYGYNGFTDNLTTLLPEDDAATVNWGADWRMWSEEERQELWQNTTRTWTTQNGVNGWLFTATNGNSLFLPAAGHRSGSSLYNAGSVGSYWKNMIDTNEPIYVPELYFTHFGFSGAIAHRSCGLSFRPVRSFGQSNAPTGAINGKFTINADGDQVYFSQGNLQYQASTNTWRFAENQYDYVGSTNSNISSTYSGWIDLFGWGTSGYNHGANCYQPWSTNQTYSDYYAYGSYTYNLYDQTGQADWGYNPISNGGNQANQWRTLTYSEWAYVFNTRTTNSGIRYAKAKVNDVNGVILLPDDWSPTTYNLNNVNTSSASFSSNTITVSQWTTFENAGAVFLPAAGDRLGTDILNVGSKGFYWSSSCNNNSYYARNVLIKDEGLSTNDSNSRRYGFSVRLVRVAE